MATSSDETTEPGEMTTINGVDLWYSDSGGGGPVLLFHHGYTGNKLSWAGVPERFTADHRVVVMEARGVGASARPDDDSYTMAQFVADIIAMLDHLGIDTCTYIGHSMGGGIGYLLALDHADRIDRLVLVAPISSGGITSHPPSREHAEELWHGSNADRMVFERFHGLARPELSTEADVRANVDRLLEVAPGHFDQAWTSMEEFDVCNRIGDLTQPTLMVAGTADGLLQANLTDFLLLPNASLHVFHRVGHSIAMDVPDEFATVLADFFEHGVVTQSTLMGRIKAADAS